MTMKTLTMLTARPRGTGKADDKLLSSDWPVTRPSLSSSSFPPAPRYLAFRNISPKAIAAAETREDGGGFPPIASSPEIAWQDALESPPTPSWSGATVSDKAERE